MLTDQRLLETLRLGVVPRSVVAVCAFALMSGLTVLDELSAAPLDGLRPSGAAIFVQADTIETVVLEPLEVTVLRTPFRLDAAPLAVAALSERDLRQGRSGAFLEEALLGLPGVQVQNRYNPAVGERVGIRGFGARAQFGSEGIRIVVDGIPATLPDGQSTLDHLDIGSLGRVEVVRGAASALFGNASGGVLSFHTRAPSLAPLQLEAEQVAGSHGLLRTSATASGTSGNTGYLITASRQRWEGFRSVTNLEGRTTYGEADRLGLNARLTRPMVGGDLSLTLNLLDLDSENPGALTEALRSDPDRPAAAVSVAQRLGKEVRQGQLGARWEGMVGNLETDLSIFGIRRSVVNPIPGVIIDLERDGGGVRAQVARNEGTGWGPLRWYAGVESDLMFDDRLNFQNNVGARGDLQMDQRERVRSAGAFLQADFPLPGAAEGLAGLRYDRHDFRAWDRFPREEEDPSGTGERTMTAVSPSVGLNVPLWSSLGLFASWGTTFETPTTLQLANRPEGAGGFNAELEPQRGNSREVGLRGWLGELAAFEVTMFHADFSNELVQFEFPDRNFYRNVGESRHTGMEATLTAASSSGLVRTNLTYSQINARFRAFEKDGVDLGGNRIPGVAPQRAQMSLRLSPGEWFGEVMGSYVDGVPANDENTAVSPSYFAVDLRAGAQALPFGNLSMAPWIAITNVFDRQYIASVHVNAFAPPANPAAARYYEPGPGRSFQLGLRATWGGGGS